MGQHSPVWHEQVRFKQFIIWLMSHTLLMMKQSVWQNCDQGKTNRNA